MTVETSKTFTPSKPPSTKLNNVSQPDIYPKVRSLVSNLSGLEPEGTKDDSELRDIGIDSLMSMEVARGIEVAFRWNLNQSKLLN